MTDHLVVRHVHRPDADAIATLARAGVATAHEALGRAGLLEPAVRPIQQGVRIAGAAVTALCQPGDNLMIHAAVETIRPGDVLVVTVRSPSTDGMIGDLLATSLRAHGCAGVVIDAGVRDSAELREMGFPVWARAVHAQGTVKATPGSVNVPVVCAGARVCPGDVVVADDDGVVIVPRDRAADVAADAQRRVDNEDAKRRRFEDGELALDMYGLRGRLVDLGVEFVDGPVDAG